MTEPLRNLEPVSPETAKASPGIGVPDMEERVIDKLRTVFDPEIPVNIYDLGLIYKIDIQAIENDKVNIHIDMTLTTPNCPVAGHMPGMVQHAVAALSEVNDIRVSLVWDPPWDRSRMSDEARLHLNMF